jgi:hypothetical protein
MLRESGLDPVVKALTGRTDDVSPASRIHAKAKMGQTALAQLPTANPSALAAALKQFEFLLASSLLAIPPRLSLLASTRLASDVQHQSLVRLSDAYADLYDAVTSGKEGYEFGTTTMRRTKDEVRTLFGIESEA